MPRPFLPAIFLLVLGLAFVPRVLAQDFIGDDRHDSFTGIDPRFPEFAHPQKDFADAMQKRDFRFIALDRALRDIPGLEGHTVLRRSYGVKIIRQHLRLFLSPSEKFSLNLRARAYAYDYNQALLKYLLKEKPKR